MSLMDQIKLHTITSLFEGSAARMKAQAGPSPVGSSAQNALTADDTTSSSDSTPPGTITASDFLTLLVTELKNQDPTSDQDPNAYITQLVGVNSLQQLIAINQDLSTAVSSATTGSTASTAIGSAARLGSGAPGSNTAGGASAMPSTTDRDAARELLARDEPS